MPILILPLKFAVGAFWQIKNSEGYFIKQNVDTITNTAANKGRLCEPNGLCHRVARTIFSLSNSPLNHAPTSEQRLINTCFQLSDFLIKLWLETEEEEEGKKKKKPHASSRRRCSWIRKLLNQRSRRAALRGPSFIFIWAGPPWSSPQGRLIEKGLQKCDC